MPLPTSISFSPCWTRSTISFEHQRSGVGKKHHKKIQTKRHAPVGQPEIRRSGPSARDVCVLLLMLQVLEELLLFGCGWWAKRPLVIDKHRLDASNIDQEIGVPSMIDIDETEEHHSLTGIWPGQRGGGQDTNVGGITCWKFQDGNITMEI